MQNRGIVPATRARRIGIGLVIALILVMVVASIAMTAQVEPTAVLDSPGVEPLPQVILGADGVAPAAVSGDDGGSWELGSARLRGQPDPGHSRRARRHEVLAQRLVCHPL